MGGVTGADMMGARSGKVRRVSWLGAALALALATSGCMTKDKSEVTGSIVGSNAAANASRSPEAWRAQADEWGSKYDQKPGDKQVSLNYARALRALDQRQQAVAVLQNAALKSPRDTEVLAAYGKALAENGDLQQAQEVLARAHSPERPDWRVLSAQGAVADQLGDHAAAQNLYTTALKIRPDDPGVLSNLGLSLALSKQLPQAEETLQRAVQQPGADARARQNLALVLALQGKFAAAEDMARRDLPPKDAAQSIASIKQMISQPNNWKKLQALDAPRAKPASAALQSEPRAGADSPG
jgi:Flp pilus assembly protein TadD